MKDRPYHINISVDISENSEIFSDRDEYGRKSINHSTHISMSFEELGKLKNFIKGIRNIQKKEDKVV